jgi:phosphoenolpyruvate synthase/pyruvate phosphate dikinase
MSTTSAADQTRALELVSLSDAASRSDEVGVKAANLGVVMAAGFPVPGGIVLTADALGRAFAGPQDAASVPLLEGWVSEVLERLGPGPVAVRSSALAEDLADASYAGQCETVLALRG